MSKAKKGNDKKEGEPVKLFTEA